MWQTDGLPYVYIGLRCFCINIALCIVRYNKNRRQQSMRIVAGRLWERGTVFAHTHTHFAPTIDQLARVTTDARHLAASQHQYHDVTCPCSYHSDILFLPFSFDSSNEKSANHAFHPANSPGSIFTTKICFATKGRAMQAQWRRCLLTHSPDKGCWNVPSRWMQKARERTEGQRNCGSKWLKQTMQRVLACRTYKRLNIVATRRPIGNWASDHQQSIDPDWPPVRSPGALPPTQQQHRSDKLTALADTQPIYCEISPMQSRRQALTSSRFVCMSVSHIYQYASSWTRQVSMSTSSIGLCLVNQSDFCGVSAADKCIGFA